jgi:fructokinase
MTDLETDYRMVGIGEILWDLLPDGKQLGGSPMNVVYHCQAAGIKSVVVSAVGLDPDGDEIINLVKNKGNHTEFIQQLADRPTGTVSVELQDGIPDFTIHKNVAWDKISWNDDLKRLAGTIDAVAFGSLAQRDEVSRTTLRNFLGSMKEASLKVFDINLRQDYHSEEIIQSSLLSANILKINDDELPVMADYLKLQGSIKTIILKILDKFKLKLVAYTRGSKGSIIYSKNIISVLPAPGVEIKDTVGAGDTFTAVLIAGLLNNKPLKQIHKEATAKAAYVCTQQGGTPGY